MTVTKAEFVERFVAHMLRIIGPKDAAGDDVEAYARDTAPSYWEEQHQRDGETPEDCAAVDVSYWEPA